MPKFIIIFTKNLRYLYKFRELKIGSKYIDIGNYFNATRRMASSDICKKLCN